MNRDELIESIDKTLKYEPDKDPYLLNSLQVIGKENIRKIALGVSANLELFDKAATWGADVIILHHGLLGLKYGVPITQVFKNRLKVLFDHNITLLTYHLFLDNHPEIGNNAQIIKLLGANKAREFGQEDSIYWGWEADFAQPVNISIFAQKLKKLNGGNLLAFNHGLKLIKRFAVVSGGGPAMLTEAINKKLDAFITGEVKESTHALAKEAAINFFSLGHYNSEKFGVIALGEVLKKKFPELEIKFIDIPNPL